MVRDVTKFLFCFASLKGGWQFRLMKLLNFLIILFPFFVRAQEEDLLASATKNEKLKLEYAIGVGYSTVSFMEFDSLNVTLGTSSGKGSGDFVLENTLTLNLESRYVPQNSWGFIWGGSYDLPRKPKNAKIKMNSTSVVVDSFDSKDTVQFFNIYLNTLYRWKNLYIPFGLNGTYIHYTAGANFTGNLQVSSGIGYQFGLGYYVNDKWVMEFMSRAIVTKFYYFEENYSATYDKGYFHTYLLNVKYLF